MGRAECRPVPQGIGVDRAATVAPPELGRAETIRWGADGVILCCGAQLHDCVLASNTLRQQGLDVGVVNARFVKPLDERVVRRA